MVNLVVSVVDVQKAVWVLDAVLVDLHPLVARQALAVLIVNGLHLLIAGQPEAEVAAVVSDHGG